MTALSRALAHLPDEALVPVSWVRRLLDVDGSQDGRLADLTCEAVGEELSRAPSTIRAWCGAGRLPGAYRLRGREWRIPRAALMALRDEERESDAGADGEPDAVDLARWREVAG